MEESPGWKKRREIIEPHSINQNIQHDLDRNSNVFLNTTISIFRIDDLAHQKPIVSVALAMLISIEDNVSSQQITRAYYNRSIQNCLI